MTPYLTEAEYRAAVGDSTAVVPERVLRAASRGIDVYLISALYETDDRGWPTDPDLLEAFRDAVVEQVKATLAYESGGSGAVAANPLGRPLSSATIDGVTWNADTSTKTIAAAFDVLPTDGSLTIAAKRILDLAVHRRVWVRG